SGRRPNGALTPESPTSLRELRPGVDPALAAIVYRALEKRPVDRFENAAQMRAALQPFVRRGVDLGVLGAGPDTAVSPANAGQPTERYPQAPPTPELDTRPDAKKRIGVPVWAVSAAGVAALVAIVSVVALRAGGNQAPELGERATPAPEAQST